MSDWQFDPYLSAESDLVAEPEQLPEQLGARPSGPVSPDDIAEWEARTYRSLHRYAPPAPGEVVLADVLLDLDELLDDPELGAATIVDELRRD